MCDYPAISNLFVKLLPALSLGRNEDESKYKHMKYIAFNFKEISFYVIK